MILSGHQPVYLPGIILFTKIALSDAFMFVGHCQASPGTWHNRNQIRNAKLVVPIKHEFGQSINEAQFAGDGWRRKHIRSTEVAYSKRPYFKNYFDEIANQIDSAPNLAGLNVGLIRKILEWLNIETKIISRSVDGHKTEMLINMCRAVGADEYLSNEGARDYVNEQSMNLAGVNHRWLKFEHPIYDQGGEFQTDLSVIDLLFNCGPDAGRIVRSAGHVG